MIKVEPQKEPPGFHDNVRVLGQEWLAANTCRDPQRPNDYWNQWAPCREHLADVFAHRCGYTACWMPSGQVEHFVSWKRCKDTGQHHLAYEWTNYRWILPQLNGRKNIKDVLDPFEVEDDWFEVNLFSLHLRLTDKVPSEHRQKAQMTIEVLGLDRDPLVVRIRAEALQRYREGSSLAGIERYSPLMARALRRLLDPSDSSLTARERKLRHSLERDHAAARKLEDQSRATSCPEPETS
jgi:hypothetical protein